MPADPATLVQGPMMKPTPAAPRPTAAPSQSAGAGASARRAALTRRLLEGPIVLTLLGLAAPNVVAVAAQTAVSMAEAWYVSRLGIDALAGLALVFPLVTMMQMMSAGAMGGGGASAVARALGSGDTAKAEALLLHIVVIAACMAGLYTLVILGLGRWFYMVLGGTGAVLEQALTYSGVIFAGAVAIWIMNMLASAIRGSGNMLVPAATILTVAALQVGLAGALVLGWGPFPALGIAGAGAAQVTAFGLGGLWLLTYLGSGAAGLRLRLGGVRLRWALFREILRVGLPACLSSLLTCATIIVVTGLVARFGAAALAGYGIGARLEFLLIPIVFGVGAALTAMVGTNVGAGDWPRARRIAWTGAAIAGAVIGAIGFTVGVWPDLWIGLYTEDPGVLGAGRTYLRIVGPAYVFFGFGMALYFASQGAGRMRWLLRAGVLRLVVATGGGWLAAAAFGLEGLFAAVAAGLLLFGSIVAGSIALGTWRG